MSLHVISGQYRPKFFFSEKNLSFLQDKIRSILKREFNEDIIIDIPSIIRVCERVVEERLESDAKMNQRVVMYLTSEYRNHYLDTVKKLKWAENFYKSSQLFDPNYNKGPFLDFKLKPRLKEQQVGGTLQFYFT